MKEKFVKNKITGQLIMSLIFPVVYVLPIFFCKEKGAWVALLVALVAGLFFAKILLSSNKNNAFDLNFSNAAEAQSMLMNSLKKRRSEGDGKFQEKLDSIAIIGSFPVIFLFLAIGLMVYMDDQIFDPKDVVKFVFVGVFQYCMFMIAFLGVFLNIFKRK